VALRPARAEAHELELRARRQQQHRVAPGKRNDPRRLAALRHLLGQQAEICLDLERVLERTCKAGLVTDLTVPEPEPQGREHPAVAARICIAGVAHDSAARTAQLGVDCCDRRAHPLATRVDGTERPRQAEQRDVGDRIADRAEIAAVELAPELALDSGADDFRRIVVGGGA
jgi:hypothetical protein